MICNNAATEMCITKGQEAIVYAWNSHKGWNDKDVLDTLFVQLVNPTTPVNLDGLPLNVVPLTRTSVTTSCRLPDDTSITVSRNQVEALPDFAMTDYASQGKTHPFNVVDLTECCSHQAYYTALSRSSTATGTLILTSFHPSKITGGASGALHQEFHELELLDNITKLRFEDKLPKSIAMADHRNTLIDLFREYKGKNYVPSTTHAAISWSKSDPFLEWQGTKIDWQVLGNNRNAPKVPDASHIVSTPKGPGDFQRRAVQLKWKSLYMVPANSKPNIKRVKFDQPENPSPTMQLSIPVGTQWQSNSCAYDAVVTVLCNIWQERPESVTADLH